MRIRRSTVLQWSPVFMGRQIFSMFFPRHAKFLLRDFKTSLQPSNMLESLEIPDDLESCQQLLREVAAAYDRLQQIHQELLDTCTSMQNSHEKLEQEKEELEETIKELMNRLYGRRSERHKFSPDQLGLDFGECDLVEVVPDVQEDEQFVAEYEKQKKKP